MARIARIPTARTARTDIHRPAAIEPADYDFVAFRYLKLEDYGDVAYLNAQRAKLDAHMARTGGSYSQHEHGGTCFICGASCIYQAVFYHRATNAYIRCGLECSDKMSMDDSAMFRKTVRGALEQIAGKKKAEAVLADAGLSAAWKIYVTTDARDDTRDMQTIRDIVGKLVQYGALSDRQMAFLTTMVQRHERRDVIAAERAAANEAAAPLPITAERVAVRGTVLAVKHEDNDGFVSHRMLVQHADGWKVWGSVPSAFLGQENFGRGVTVEFMAALVPSDRDSKFGFFKRPSKARIVA
jgi:hypothetical protein